MTILMTLLLSPFLGVGAAGAPAAGKLPGGCWPPCEPNDWPPGGVCGPPGPPEPPPGGPYGPPGPPGPPPGPPGPP
ncbi:MAG: hypothetical protein GEV28_07065 [Actinophytocola sp.]|nr:hypothetical protein [Actinophytocola sp.]